MTRRVRVQRPGLQSLVVDRGRFGLRDRGVAWCGAMDLRALTDANRMVGNDPDAAALEVVYGDVTLHVDAPVRVALAGADCTARADGMPIPSWHACEVRTELRLERPQSWMRTIVAFEGGIDVPVVLGSRTTDCLARFGGVEGRALRAGDTFALGPPRDGASGDLACEPPVLRPEVRVIATPGYDALWAQRWTISHESNRMGWRLRGTPMAHDLGTIPSCAVFPGVVQLPPAGEPIVLGSDAQTTGGYPIAGVVVEADLWMLAQLPLGSALTLRPCTLEEAEAP